MTKKLGIIKTYSIVIRLTNTDRGGAKDVAEEIRDKMLPDYEDCIKSIRVVVDLE